MDSLGTVGQPGDRLRAADAIDRIHPGHVRRGEQDICDFTVRAAWRRCEHDLANARHARGHRGHQHAAGIGRAAARRVHRYSIEWSDELAERTATWRMVKPRFATAVLVEGANPIGGGLQSTHYALPNALDGLIDLGIADT